MPVENFERDVWYWSRDPRHGKLASESLDWLMKPQNF